MISKPIVAAAYIYSAVRPSCYKLNTFGSGLAGYFLFGGFFACDQHGQKKGKAKETTETSMSEDENKERKKKKRNEKRRGRSKVEAFRRRDCNRNRSYSLIYRRQNPLAVYNVCA